MSTHNGQGRAARHEGVAQAVLPVKFEHDLDNVRWAVEARQIDYPVAIDNDFAVWHAFANHYWPALYFVDAEGRIRHHRFGEGDYERSEMVTSSDARTAAKPLLSISRS